MAADLHAAKDPRYPPLGVAVDMVVLTVVDGTLQVLLTLRPEPPFDHCWSLPGGFIGPKESAADAAARELRSKAGVENVFLEQLYTFSEPERDPRSRVVSVAYYALVSPDRLANQKGLRETRWFRIHEDPQDNLVAGDPAVPLAFDHATILTTAIQRIRGKLEYAPIGFQLLPKKFTLTELQRVHEAVLGHSVDKRNFRHKMLKSGLVRELDEHRKGPHRPARLYEFTQQTF